VKLLIIDDNEEIVEVMTAYLEHVGFDIKGVNNGKEGLNLIENGDFDKVLLDLSMPKFSGFDLIENLKQKNFQGFNKIYVLSAVSLSQQEIAKLLAYGINSCTTKPIEMAKLVQKLRN